MKYSLWIVFIILLFPFTGEAQDIDSFRQKFISADSIQIVSHEDLDLMNKKTGTIAYRKIFPGNKPNYAIVKEVVTLDKHRSDQLYKLLVSGKTEEYDRASCFVPHHAIFIFKDGVCYGLDFCFECRGTARTDNYTIDVPIFHNEKVWTSVCDFFREQGIQYEMPPAGRYGY
ncbi:hypothetical protein AAEO56_08430 [Flavobacterium sp. DGU11]|uniref:GLPGLI family protein n=1 Tax=Flavobacterium arundinis TaxID=3139143 RepID=A0ABU9HVU8_9FLAO